MWYRISIRYTDLSFRSGIRKIDDDNIYRVEMRVLETLKHSMHRILSVDISPLPEDHTDVQKIIQSGAPIKTFDTN